MESHTLPTVVIAGLGGDSGKSLLAIGLIGAFRKRGFKVIGFKKGPDFIDAAWLGKAAEEPGRNLDTYLMSQDAILKSVEDQRKKGVDVAVVEGNRGLFDGMTATGEHSTAVLARMLGAPILLVVDVTKSTRTVAALIKGCEVMETGLQIGGVVLNQVATKRQERIIREAVAMETSVPVMGAIYRRKGSALLPSRHLGLLTAAEHPDVESALDIATEMVDGSVDIEAVLKLGGAPSKKGDRGIAGSTNCSAKMESTGTIFPKGEIRRSIKAKQPKIGVLKDNAFSFYYPENLEALEALGATLVELSPIADTYFPDEINGLYAGGGFPEVYAEALAVNVSFREMLLARIERGMPVFAECGGLMYLARALTVDEETYPMVGALPIDVIQRKRPMGHGYVRGTIRQGTPWFEKEQAIRGHEFHYSEITSNTTALNTVLVMDKGVGIGGGRDGIVHHRVLAFYTHFHSLGLPSWAPGFLKAILQE